MTVLQPTDEQVYKIAKQLGMSVDAAKVALLQPRFADFVAAYKAVDDMADPLPEVKYPRTPAIARGRRKTPTMLGITKQR